MYSENETEQAVERRLQKECTTVNLGTLGNRDGVNVAKVEVQWWKEDPGDGHFTRFCYEGGFYVVHATGDEPEAQSDGSIYNVFHDLVTEAMEIKVEARRIDGYEILDTSAY